MRNASLDEPRIPVSSESYWQDPYSVLSEFQAHFRCAWTDKGELAILQWQDAYEALRGEDFVNEGIEMLEERGFQPGDPLHTWRSSALGIMHGEHHLRVRRLVSRAMSRQSIEPLRPMIREHANALLDGLPVDEPVDLKAAFTARIPRIVMVTYLGIDEEELEATEQPLAGANIADCFGPRVTEAMRNKANTAIDLVMQRVEALYRAREADPRDDLLTRLLEAEENNQGLTMPELITLFSTIFASGATTGNALTAAILELVRHEDQAELLRGDPEVFKRGATEESLRLHPGFSQLPQKATRSQEAFGHTFEKGDKIIVPFGAANRDPGRWADPQRFDITRDPGVSSLTFGIGPHFCLGQAMARITMEECLSVVFSRYPKLELLEQPRWVPFVMEPRVESLMLKLGSR